MHAKLADSICLFRKDQESALDYIHGKLAIPVPRTAYHWAADAHPQIASASAIASIDGVTLYVHGFGIEISHPDFHIDYDYGPAGQCDCFDTWRLSLHRHFQLGLADPVDDPRPLDDWLADAEDAGELVHVSGSHSMYYHPLIRSRWSPPVKDVRNDEGIDDTK